LHHISRCDTKSFEKLVGFAGLTVRIGWSCEAIEPPKGEAMAPWIRWVSWCDERRHHDRARSCGSTTGGCGVRDYLRNVFRDSVETGCYRFPSSVTDPRVQRTPRYSPGSAITDRTLQVVAHADCCGLLLHQ
jgi:hypothetical protein